MAHLMRWNVMPVSVTMLRLHLILDMFLDMYEERLEQGPIAFQDWVAHEYDPEALTQRFAKRRITSR